MFYSFFSLEPKFQVTGFGWWEAEDGLGFYIPVQKGNGANAFQTQKLKGGLSCTLIWTLNAVSLNNWLGIMEI